MKFARVTALFIAFVIFPTLHSINSQEPPSGRIAPIGRLPGYDEGRHQADLEREEAESRQALSEPKLRLAVTRHRTKERGCSHGLHHLGHKTIVGTKDQ